MSTRDGYEDDAWGAGLLNAAYRLQNLEVGQGSGDICIRAHERQFHLAGNLLPS